MFGDLGNLDRWKGAVRTHDLGDALANGQTRW
jgi:hypothetical protein